MLDPHVFAWYGCCLQKPEIKTAAEAAARALVGIVNQNAVPTVLAILFECECSAAPSACADAGQAMPSELQSQPDWHALCGTCMGAMPWLAHRRASRPWCIVFGAQQQQQRHQQSPRAPLGWHACTHSAPHMHARSTRASPNKPHARTRRLPAVLTGPPRAHRACASPPPPQPWTPSSTPPSRRSA